eukprot:1347281-Rhodomonas_salina.1
MRRFCSGSAILLDCELSVELGSLTSGNLRGLQLEARRDADLGSPAQQSLLSGLCFPTEGEARLNTAHDPNVQPLNQ